MYLLFRAYLLFNRLVGLNNLGFNSNNTKKHVFTRHYRPAFVYCMLLNSAYLILLPFAARNIIHELYLTANKNLLIIIIYVSSFVSIINFVTTIINAWAQRGNFCQLLNQYARVLRKYHKQIFAANTLDIRNKAKRLLLIKAAASCCRLTMFYIFLYGQFKRRPAVSYVLSTLYIGTLETLLILVDCNIFMGLLTSNTLLSIYVQHLRSIQRDVSLLHELEHKPKANRQASKLTHAAWRTQLCVELRVLMLQQRRARNMIKSLLQIYQWQLLFALFCSLCTQIVMLFRLVLYIDDAENFHLGFFIFNVVVIAANLCNIQLLFDICERILQHFLDMRYLLECMLIHCEGGAGGGAQTLLQRSIELFLLQLQQDSMQLNLCRLFNLNRHAGHQMNSAAVGYLIVVIQIAVKEW